MHRAGQPLRDPEFRRRPGRAIARGPLLLSLLFCLGGSVQAATGGGESRALRYGRDIRPLLSDRCFVCHGPDERRREAKLRLDERESVTADRGGYAAIVPGDVVESELWARVTSHSDGERMPPPESNKKPLSPAELELVRAWIEAGAPYEPHWAFSVPERPEPPGAELAAEPDPVDRFVRAELARAGYDLSPAAGKETLLRRLMLDLTGLPPTPEELREFLADERPDAYEAWIERIFNEEPYRSRYAEKMASPWLDAARYADTSGIHTDAGRQIWLWRDWVLGALRDNMPFDRFVTEQIAGDLLPGASEAQKVASGFHRNHVTTDEGGAIDAEYLVEYAVDRTATTGSVFLGLTLGCARCHEHKFDPISQEEFYQLYAYFNSIEEPGLYSQLPDPKRAFEPFLEVPTPEQKRELESLQQELAGERAKLEAPAPAEDDERAAHFARTLERAGLRWAPSEVVSARSLEGATLTVQGDGSVLASGANPPRDEHELVLSTEGTELSLLALEALTDASLPLGRVGRAFNGNAVLTGVEAVAVSTRDPARQVPLRFEWAWADHEQEDGDHRAVNVLDTHDDLGWAVDAHRRAGGRLLYLLAQEPFGFEGGTELRVRLQYRSIYDEHTLGHVRLSLATLGPGARDLLPAAVSGWYFTGAFPAESRDSAFDQRFGPEEDTRLDLGRGFGPDGRRWSYDAGFKDGEPRNYGNGLSASYLGRRIFSPSERELELSLGSDDGYRLFLNGREVAGARVDRSLAPDQERVKVVLARGTNVLVMRIANTGGPAGFYYRALPRADEIAPPLLAAWMPAGRLDPVQGATLVEEWRVRHSPAYLAARERIASLEGTLAMIRASVPRAMVMRELAMPRDTYLLMRGAYDKPDLSHKLERGVPAALGALPAGAPKNRLGLAQWLVAPENPLVARVAVNRIWEHVFGSGIVRTSEDFGMQGEWPSHPELLDWLAVELRESGWDVQHVLRLLLESRTYRQDSRVRPEVREIDPDNRLLAYFPRRRLSAEEIRDQALYVGGLLVEKLGGPSVKPYQPDGLWQEVAMPASNTRFYERGVGEELWRRSLYTYWKRACPPPSLMTFDAPTRESCTIRRASTNTPLQALVLWNDEQFVEAARSLAARSLHGPGSDGERLTTMYQRCTSRLPTRSQLDELLRLLGRFRERYREDSADAERLIAVGDSLADPLLDARELAAWTMVASALFSLDATLTRS